MRIVYLAFRTFPFWSLPLVLILAELGRHYYRSSRKAQYPCWAGVLLLLALTGLWFIFRGDLNSDQWVRALIE